MASRITSTAVVAALIGGVFGLFGKPVDKVVEVFWPTAETRQSSRENSSEQEVIHSGSGSQTVVQGTYNQTFNYEKSSQESYAAKRDVQFDDTINRLIHEYESWQLPMIGDYHDIPDYKAYSKAIELNPYDTRALVHRANIVRSWTTMNGGKGYREALTDFRQVLKLDNKIADPHFGLGSLYQDLALFDIVRRRLFIAPSSEHQAKNTTFKYDKENEEILQAALNEFQEGKRLRQLYERGRTGAILMTFTPQNVDRRIGTVRQLLRYEPIDASADEDFHNTFFRFMLRLNPAKFP